MKRWLSVFSSGVLLVVFVMPFLTVSSQSTSYKQRVLGTKSDALIAYWTLEEIAGGTAHDASGNLRHASLCTGSNSPTWNADYFADGVSPATRFDGDDCVNAFSSSLASVFNGNSGTMLLWFKAFSGTVWSDGVFRRLFWAFVNGSNLFTVQHLNSTLSMIRIATIDKRAEPTIGGTGWQNLAIVWSTSANEVRFYLNGALVSTATAVGTFSGTLVDMVIGASDSSGAFGWNGFISHVALWNVALPSIDIALLSVIDTSSLTPVAPLPTDTPTPTPNLSTWVELEGGQVARVDYIVSGGEWFLAVLGLIQVGLLTWLAFISQTRRYE